MKDGWFRGLNHGFEKHPSGYSTSCLINTPGTPDMEEDLPQPVRTDCKRKAAVTTNTRILSDCTLRKFSFYYLQISLVTQQSPINGPQLDELTVKKYFSAATVQRFGLLGSAVSVDMLKLDGNNAWIRVPFEDRAMVTEALSSWAGNALAWRIKESGCWLGGMVGSDGQDLFND